MMRCETCQPLILDHLYGLLDGAEAAAVEAHLRECPACRAARDDAARMQGLIARAAKQAFPRVRFEPTAKATRSSLPALPKLGADAPQPAGQAGSSRSPQRTSWAAVACSWAVAAAVVLAIPATVLPVVQWLNQAQTSQALAATATARARHATQDAQHFQRQLTQEREGAARALADARQAHDALLNRWVADEHAMLQALADRNRLLVDVRKPAAIQPGAPNDFLISIRGDRSTAANARLFAEIRDQTDAVIFSQRLDLERRGDTPIRLPAQAWTRLQPQSELFLVITSEDQKTGARTAVQDRIRLFGPVYATMLTTDKPTYRPGETVYFRSLTLDRVTFKPPEREQLLHFELLGNNRTPVRHLSVTGSTDLVRVVQGQVEAVRGPDGKPLRGVGSGAFALPADLDEGEYTLVLHELPHPAGYPPAVPFPVVRPIQVRSGPTDVYHKIVRFGGAAYRPGETVEGWTELKFEDQPLVGAAVQIRATADGAPLEVTSVQPATGPDGRVHFRFTLPSELERGDVRLKVTVHARHGESIREESVAERVPVVGRSLIVEFFPEGGTLVAGVPCRVYFRATTPTGVPVDLRGVITDGRHELARVETLQDAALPGVNRGIGSFTYTPTLGTPVWLKLENGVYTPLLEAAFPTAPAALAGVPVVASVRTRFALPAPQVDGVVMTVPDTVTSPGEPIRVHLWSVGKDRNLVVGAYTRGRLADTQKVTARPGELTEVQLLANGDARGGVVRITVFEELPEEPGQPTPDLKPLAERLVFRRPGELLNLNVALAGPAVRPDATGYLANAPIELTITATDEKGQPTAAVLWAAAVNAGVAPGPKDRLLTTHFLLAGEISTPDALEHADFLLTDHPRAAEALDGVLATQGWRRFAEQTPAPLTRRTVIAPPERAALNANSGHYGTWGEAPGQREHRRLYEVYQPRYEAAKKALEAAEARQAAVLADFAAEQRLQQLLAQTNQVQQEAAAAQEQAAAAAQPLQRFQRAGWYGVAGFGLLAVLLAVVGVRRPVVRLPLSIGTLGSLGLVAFLIVALGRADSVQAGDGNRQAQPDVAAAAVEAPARTNTADAQPFAVTTPVAPAPRTGQPTSQPNREPERVAVSAPAGSAPMGLATSDGPGVRSGTPAAAGSTDAAFSGGVATTGGAAKDLPSTKQDRGLPGTSVGPDSPALPPTLLPGAGGIGGVGGGGGGLASKGSKGPPGGGLGGSPFGGPMAQDQRPVGGPLGGVFPVVPPLPIPPAAMGPLHPIDGGGGWQPADKAGLIPDADLKDTQGAGPRSKMVTRKAPAAAPTLLANRSPSPAETFQTELRLVQEYTQQQNQAAMEQLFRAYAQKHAIPPEQLKEQVSNWLSGRGGGNLPKNLPKMGPMPPRPPGGFGRGLELEMFPGLPPVPEIQALFRVQVAMLEPTPLVVREYAAPRPGSTGVAGAALPDTILWQPVIVLPNSGKTTIPFHLGSAEGGYQLLVAGHTLDGRLGAVRTFVPIASPGSPEAVAPSGSISPKAP
jgi:hypothetical protein